MSIPINRQRQLIEKYYNLLVKEFIKDLKHKNFDLIFEDFEEQLKLGNCRRNKQIS